MHPPITPTLQQYKDALARFDWSYEYSEDMDIWRRGKAHEAKLHAMQKDLDPSGEIWMECRPGVGPLPLVQEVKAHG